MADNCRKRVLSALKSFSPKVLIKHLVRNHDGVLLVDRSALVLNQEDRLNFYCILDRIYGSGFKNMEYLTIFFETDGVDIWGGAYNAITNEIVSKRRLISQSTSTPYTYTEKDLSEFRSVLLQS